MRVSPIPAPSPLARANEASTNASEPSMTPASRVLAGYRAGSHLTVYPPESRPRDRLVPLSIVVWSSA